MFLAFFILFFLVALAHKMGEQQAPQSLASQHAAADQETHETPVSLSATLMFLAFLIFFFLVALAQKMGE
jgi:hypothetical protein